MKTLEQHNQEMAERLGKEWSPACMPTGIECPKCKSELVADVTVALTSDPPQTRVRCHNASCDFTTSLRLSTVKTLITVLLLSALCLSSCREREDFSKGLKGDYRTVVIEGCEYIEFDVGAGQSRAYSLTHKGNCKNPIHRHQP